MSEQSSRPRCAVCDARAPDHAVGCAAFACRGADLIKAERRRQIQEEGWTPEHDDEHVHVELPSAAACYIDAARAQAVGLHLANPSSLWPWDASWWKPSDDPIRNLVKAGALIAAEIDRLHRASGGES